MSREHDLQGLGATHDVVNQPPPLEDVNLLALDRPLCEGLAREGATGFTHLVRDLGGVDLRDAPARIVGVRGGGRVGEQARRRDPRRHARQGQLDRLVLRDRLAERRSLLRVTQRRLERRLRQPDADRRDAEPRERQDRRAL